MWENLVKSYCLLQPTWEELHAAYGPYSRGCRQGEHAYKVAFMRWRVLERAGLIKFRGGWVKLTKRGYVRWNRMVCERNGWVS